MSEIIIYQSKDNQPQVYVQFENETFWLSRQQLSILFDRDIKTIGKHINNVFLEGELIESSVVAKFATTASDGKTYKMEHYNLDVIISVGYRVKSKRGTQFRQWATQRLKEHLLQGYTINQKRLAELGQMVQLVQNATQFDTIQLQEAKGLLEILSKYTKSFVLLNQYDRNAISNQNLSENITYEIQYEEAKYAISELKRQLIIKNEATELFGKEKDEGFKSSLMSIVQTFDKQYLYPSIEE